MNKKSFSLITLLFVVLMNSISAQTSNKLFKRVENDSILIIDTTKEKIISVEQLKNLKEMRLKNLPDFKISVYSLAFSTNSKSNFHFIEHRGYKLFSVIDYFIKLKAGDSFSIYYIKYLKDGKLKSFPYTNIFKVK